MPCGNRCELELPCRPCLFFVSLFSSEDAPAGAGELIDDVDELCRTCFMCVLFRLTADCSLYDEEGTGEEGFSALRDEEEDVAGIYIEDGSVDVVYDSGDERLGDLEFRGNESRDRLWRLRRVDKVRRILLVDEDIVALTERVSSLLIPSAVFISNCQ
jgi:hypothetical protein